MFISSPTLGDYSFRLFDIHYPVEMYPLLLKFDDAVASELELKHIDDTSFHKITNEEDLVSTLKRAFASRRVKKVIMSLISQAKAIGMPTEDDIPF